MKNSRIAISQRSIQVGNTDRNTQALISDIQTAQSRGVGMLIGTELMVSGYMAGDAFEDTSWIGQAESQNARIVEATRGSHMAVIWGNIKTDPSAMNEDGRMRKYNAAYIAQGG